LQQQAQDKNTGFQSTPDHYTCTVISISGQHFWHELTCLVKHAINHSTFTRTSKSLCNYSGQPHNTDSVFGKTTTTTTAAVAAATTQIF
jgi:hypothetical protein